MSIEINNKIIDMQFKCPISIIISNENENSEFLVEYQKNAKNSSIF